MSRLGPWSTALLLAFSAAGLASSLLVLYEYYTLHRPPPLCEIPRDQGPIQLNCELVLSSPYSRVGPFSLDALAAAWFIVNISLALIVVYAPLGVARASARALFGWRFVGLAIVPYLVYVELFVIRAICIYCTIMHAMIIADFIVVSVMLFGSRSPLRRALWGAGDSHR